jgi:hypothetical protein
MTERRVVINLPRRRVRGPARKLPLCRVLEHYSRKDLMNPTMNRAAHPVDYRFNNKPADHICPLCGSRFRSRLGVWPFLAGSADAVCGGADCPVGDDVTGSPPCDTLFAFPALDPATIEAIRSSDESAGVGRRLQLVADDESLPADDRSLLQRAALDLLFWEADETTIHELEPVLGLRTCGQAAAELLLSGCGDIL